MFLSTQKFSHIPVVSREHFDLLSFQFILKEQNCVQLRSWKFKTSKQSFALNSIKGGEFNPEN